MYSALAGEQRAPGGPGHGREAGREVDRRRQQSVLPARLADESPDQLTRTQLTEMLRRQSHQVRPLQLASGTTTMGTRAAVPAPANFTDPKVGFEKGASSGST